MAWPSRVRCNFQLLLLAAALLLVGLAEVKAAYRLTFQNGTSLEVQGYEDLGDSIRYSRFGGAVTVPKANVTAIQELPPAPAAPTPPATAPRVAPVPAPTGIPNPPAPTAPAPRTSPPAAPRPGPVRSGPGQPVASVGFVSGAVWIIGAFALPLLVLAGVVLLFRFLTVARRTETDLPYEKAGPLLTAAERSFYGVLCQAVDARYPVFAKVRLGDVLTIPRGTLRFWTYRNKIDRKHVDFVLCAPDDLAPLLVIELDDASHAREDRRGRDAFVDAALDAAGLPILHVPAQRAYAPAEIRGLIGNSIRAGENVATYENL